MRRHLELVLRRSRQRSFPRIKRPFRTEQALLEISRLHDGDLGTLATGMTPDEAIEAIRKHLDLVGSLAALDRRMRRALPHLLFLAPDSNKAPLFQLPGLLEQFESIASENPNRFLPAAVHSLLSHYPYEAVAFEPWRATLESLVGREELAGIRELRRTETKWRALSREGPVNVAQRILDTEGLTPHDVRRELFPYRSSEHERFGELVQNTLLEKTSTRLRTKSLSPSALDRIVPFYQGDDGKLGLWRVPLAEALLTPFHDQDPEPEIRKTLEGFLLQALGDPRRSARGWSDVCTRCRQAMMRWLVRRSFAWFFDVIERSLEKQGISYDQWIQRRSYWEERLERGLVVEAWPVFGPGAAEEALRRGIPQREFGTIRQRDSPWSSAIVMGLRGRAGSIRAVEWSDNGAFRGWQQDAEGTPTLYAESYLASTLRATLGVLFRRSHLGKWERCFDEELHRHIGAF